MAVWCVALASPFLKLIGRSVVLPRHRLLLIIARCRVVARCRVIAILSLGLRRRIKGVLVEFLFMPPSTRGTVRSCWQLMMLLDSSHQRGSAKQHQGTKSYVKPH